jgi:hypothetical protein
MIPRALRRPSILLRVLLYLAVIIALWRALPRGAEQDDELRFGVAGADLAPDLVGRLVKRYMADYPGAKIDVTGGGTRHALEAMLQRRADVAFTCRTPSAEEQQLFRAAIGDTLLCFPIAEGELLLLRPESAAAGGTNELQALLRGEPLPAGAAFEKVYAADPNLGTWERLSAALGVPLPESPVGRVVFLADDAAVARAVSSDARSLGVASSFAVGAAQRWIAEGIGELPLFACCSSRARRHAAMFVTHVTGPRGQRQIEDAGFRPAEPIVREVYLTRDPVGR